MCVCVLCVDSNQINQTKQQLLEAYLDVTQAVASSLSDLLDDQAADVTAAIPIIRQVGSLGHLRATCWCVACLVSYCYILHFFYVS